MCKEPLKGLLKHLFEWKEQGQIELLMIKVKGNYSSVTWFPLICHLDMVIIHVFYWVSCCPNKGSLTFHCHSSVQLPLLSASDRQDLLPKTGTTASTKSTR